jgi:hypothetical protein
VVLFVGLLLRETHHITHTPKIIGNLVVPI